ncbi:MAG TPA: hypothetical protein PLU17_10285 [Chitinophagaceae bacterium]|nr:hypothetical protein [Chitinophagaceae bacterium]
MEEGKKLGIWMCHSSVHVVEYNSELIEEQEQKRIDGTNQMDTNIATSQNESFHLQTESFKKLGIAIEKYEEVVLFGPVDTKVELLKFLKADPRFDKIKIEIKQTNIMSEDQQEAYVEKYFANEPVQTLK